MDFFRFVGGVVAYQLEERMHPRLRLQLLLGVRKDEVSKQRLLDDPPSGDMNKKERGREKID